MARPISPSPEAVAAPPVVVIGTGGMAAAYVKALKALGRKPARAIGRDPARAAKFGEAHGVKAVGGGLAALNSDAPSPVAIVAVSHAALAPVSRALIDHGCRTILLEKPGALFHEDLEALHALATAAGAQVFVAYNRRFYSSVTRLAQAIEADGGLLSCQFEFTEIERFVIHDGFPEEVLHRWGLVNSTHVIDLAFFLAGRPRALDCHVAAGLPWHPAGAVFTGSGVSTRGVAFSYHADWASAGRWKLNLYTAERRYLLEPLETLQVQERGQFTLETLAPGPCPEAEAGIKPGLYYQLAALFQAHAGARDSRLCPLAEHLGNWPVYERMLGYDRGRQTKNSESATPASVSTASQA